MLLYIGALTDVRPLMRFAHAHKEFVYVDGLPASKYFLYNDWMDSVEKIQQIMVAELKRENAFKKLLSLEDHFIIETIGGQTLYYFFNTLDTEIFKNATLCTFLPNVSALYMCGFSPEILHPLPALKT